MDQEKILGQQDQLDQQDQVDQQDQLDHESRYKEYDVLDDNGNIYSVELLNPEYADYSLENEAAYIRAVISWYDAGEYKKYKERHIEKYTVPDTEELLSEDENFKGITMEELETVFNEITEYSLSEEVESHWDKIFKQRAKYDVQDHQMKVLSESYNKARNLNKRYTGDKKADYNHDDYEYIDNAYLAIADNMYDKGEFIKDLENRFLARVIKSFKERVMEKYIQKLEREELELTDQDKKAVQRKITTEICIQLINEQYGSNKSQEQGNNELFKVLKECCPDKDVWYSIQQNAIRVVYLESFERSVVRLMRRDLGKTRYKYFKEKSQTDSYSEADQQEDKRDKPIVGTKPRKRPKKVTDETCSLYEIYISKADPLVVAAVDKTLDKVSKAARNEESAKINRAIVLGRMKGLQFNEIAKELNTTKSNISKRVQMLKKILDDELQEYNIKIG